MEFNVRTSRWPPPTDNFPRADLVVDEWDDWFEFSTMYTLIVYDENGKLHRIGSVKIGQYGMAKKQRRPAIDDTFETLDERFFSLGQDDSYYDNLNEQIPHLRDEVLVALNDLAVAESLDFTKALKERVTTISLLRDFSKKTVRDQFRRIALGGERLSEYDFTYTIPKKPKHPRVKFHFKVEPGSQPPTNIHVIIGRNGVGKTHLLNAMSRAFVEDDEGRARLNGKFESAIERESEGFFANLVSVTFSAFDPFEPISASQARRAGVKYSYIGLKRLAADSGEKALPPKSIQRLSREFADSAKVCRKGPRAGRWARALHMLESDPIFKEAKVATLAPSDVEEDGDDSAGAKIFRGLSSGHKIVLLTITKLVETVAERTLVLLDEPEAHLHPPLLSAFIRALSDLLVNRNGVAIVATHSPVILQEVPKSCVWKLRRSGAFVAAERPELETFGENVGILTREVFGLEVTNSGFHRLIADSVLGDRSYEDVLERFSGQLGSEARAMVRGLIVDRDEGES